MNAEERFGGTVSRWLHSRADLGSPDYLDDLLGRTSDIRQRPAWALPERWFPMQTTLHLAPVPRAAWLLVVLAALAVLGAAILAGAMSREAEPFGLARNGSVAYGGSDGDIYALDPVTGQQTVIVSGPTVDFAPSFSPDGSRFLFVRDADLADQYLLMLANHDGTGIRQMAGPLSGLDWFAWSPDGSRVAVVSDLIGERSLWVLAMDGTRVPLLGGSLTAEAVQWRPDGRELVFRGTASGPGAPTYALYAVGADGSDLRPILPPTHSDGDWQAPALSPDGTRIVYTQWDSSIGGHLWAVGLDGGGMRMLRFDTPFASEYYAHWSADGTRILFLRWSGTDYHVAIAPAAGGHVVELGPAMPQGNGAAEMEFSPDGSKVIARYAPDDSTWILDVESGQGQQLPATEFLASWRRLAR